jgi:hypothetical protein
LEGLGRARIQLSVQWIEKYSYQAVVTGIQPTQAAAEVLTPIHRRANPAITEQ